jgi:hypothetical protein
MSYKIQWKEKAGKRWATGWMCVADEPDNIDVVRFKPPETLRDADGYPLFYGEISTDGTVIEWKNGKYVPDAAEITATQEKKAKVAFYESYIDVLFQVDKYKDFSEFQAAMKAAKGG